MKRFHASFYITLLCGVLVLLCACKKNNDPPTLTKTDMLVGTQEKEWRKAEILCNGKVQSFVQEDYAYRITFNRDGSTKEQSNEKGNWSLINNESQIIIRNSMGSDTFDILNIAQKEIRLKNVTTAIDIFGQPFQAEKITKYIPK